ncbi:MAG: LysR family transcriptional regulator [Myxococcota bacterium]
MQVPDIELSELRYFHCVATSRSFAEGARRAHVSASTVSKAIKKLEEALGAVLLDRSSRQVALTEVGEIAFEHATRVLGSLHQLVNATDDALGRVRGDLHLGSTEEFAADALPRTLSRLAQEHPELRVHTYLMGPQEVERRLLEGELDLGLVTGVAPVAAELESEVLLCSPERLICGRQHPLFAAGQVDPEALVQFPFVVPRYFGEHTPGDRYPKGGPPRTIGATVELVQMAVQMVLEGHFLAYLPEVMIRCQLNHDELRPVECLRTTHQTELSAWRRPGVSTRNRVVLTALRSALEESLQRECPV